MIAHLRGTLLQKQPTRLVLDVGGVGYEVLVPLTTSQAAGEVGEAVALHTVLVVREDSQTLYGFSEPQERALFLKLVGVSGIGPKIALGALSGLPPGDLVAAIRDQNVALLTRLPGIGKKTAERMALELKDSLSGFGAAPPAAGDRVSADAVAALISLGYSVGAAAEAVRKAVPQNGGSVEDLVRAALARLSGPPSR